MLILSCLSTTKPRPRPATASAGGGGTGTRIADIMARVGDVLGDAAAVAAAAGPGHPQITSLTTAIGELQEVLATVEATREAMRAAVVLPEQGGAAGEAEMATPSPVNPSAPAPEPPREVEGSSSAAGATMAPGAVGGSASAASPAADKATAVSSALQAVAAAAKNDWHPTGLLSEPQAIRCQSACMLLLKQLSAHAARWGPSLKELLMPSAAAASASDAVSSTPSPSACTQAVLQLLARVTRRHQAALRCLSDGGPRLLLSLPQSCLFPSFARAEPLIITKLLNMLEDPVTLDAWIEGEIRAFFASRPQPRGYTPHPVGAQARVSQVCVHPLGLLILQDFSVASH